MRLKRYHQNFLVITNTKQSELEIKKRKLRSEMFSMTSLWNAFGIGLIQNKIGTPCWGYQWKVRVGVKLVEESKIDCVIQEGLLQKNWYPQHGGGEGCVSFFFSKSISSDK